MKKFVQSLLKNFQSGCGWEKLTWCATGLRVLLYRCEVLGAGFSGRVCSKIFNQGPVKIFQSGFDENFQITV
jgi:hypothetical protein